MKLSSKEKKVLQNINQNQGQFFEDLQHSLVEHNSSMNVGIDQFQRLYRKKKIISDTIGEYHEKNHYYKADIQRAKQRIYQIAQLNDKANKQSIYMRNQINKINDAHMMSKILMMQKIVRLGVQNQNLQRKRTNCHSIRQQKHRMSDIGQSLFQKKRRIRQFSVMESKALKSYVNEISQQTMQQNRSKADKIKSQKQRRKQKLMRYQKFKQEQAQKNYASKTQSLRRNLQEKHRLLQTLHLQQQKQLRHYRTTQHVTKQYLQSMYQTTGNSTAANTIFFPTQTI